MNIIRKCYNRRLYSNLWNEENNNKIHTPPTANHTSTKNLTNHTSEEKLSTIMTTPSPQQAYKMGDYRPASETPLHSNGVSLAGL